MKENFKNEILENKMLSKKVNNYKHQGITLISLVITIVVLLILAGASIAMIMGSNGILNNATKSEEKTKISEEKEKVKISQSADLISNNGKNNTKQGLQQELDKIEGINKTKVIKDGRDSYIVTFLGTNRNYKISYGKDIEGPVEIERIEDSQAGDITKGNTLDGSKEKPYQINCIEDLVDFSNKSKTNNFSGKEIIMTKNLDFQSELSYEDYTIMKYGDINNDGITSELIEELTTGTGFEPISKSSVNTLIFDGTFDGKKHKIDNIYMNSLSESVGLFGRTGKNSNIKNLRISGEIIQNSTLQMCRVGGIVGSGNGKIEFCNNSCNIQKKGSNRYGCGGISGYYDGTIYSCSNNGKLESAGLTGGIVGTGNAKIINCYNKGTVNGQKSVACGINGGDYWASGASIYNCYNFGNITSENSTIYNATSGIYGYMANNIGKLNIINSWNAGKIENLGKRGKAIIGQIRIITPNILNCFYLETTSIETSIAQECNQDYMQSEEFINQLNTYIETNNNTKGWAKWIQVKGETPTLDFNTIWDGEKWTNINL